MLIPMVPRLAIQPTHHIDPPSQREGGVAHPWNTHGGQLLKNVFFFHLYRSSHLLKVEMNMGVEGRIQQQKWR